MSTSIMNIPIPSSVPYPFYSSPDTLLEFFNQMFSNKKRYPIGFMPCKTPLIPYAASLEITITKSKGVGDSYSYCSSPSCEDSSVDTVGLEDNIPGMLNETTTNSIPHCKMTKLSHEIPLETFSLFDTPSRNEDSFVNATLKQKERQPLFTKKKKVIPLREIRSNPDYLRMIVAEVNMMCAQKITSPLKPRRLLPKRLDPFQIKPSPLIYNFDNLI